MKKILIFFLLFLSISCSSNLLTKKSAESIDCPTVFFASENRNYLYHINKHSNRIWSIVLGKFSLAFSMAPEFYRQIYKENPPKVISEASIQSDNNLVSKTSWQEIIDNKGGKHGDD